uniref:Uncharacterized protein n=1 Tax=Manihot esculenta TaxID=3983 RepID=A0A2C9VBY9_MANES
MMFALQICGIEHHHNLHQSLHHLHCGHFLHLFHCSLVLIFYCFGRLKNSFQIF